MKLPLSRVAEFISARGHFDRNSVAEAYSIDSRTLLPGQLFFAVQGERIDGHDFVQQALAKGAVAAVIRKDEASRFHGEQCLEVDDTLRALQTLATAVRRLWGRPLIAVTGSAGKTTTKEAIAHVLAAKFTVMRSEGNFNNHFGLPLMLLKLESEHDLAVIEMGMSHAGEIAALAKIAMPDVGVVTNVAPVHLEFFDSIEGIARAKYELIEALTASGVAVLNADDKYVSQFGKDSRAKVITYGLNISANVRAENIESQGANGALFDVVAAGSKERAALPLVGAHNIHNALAAVAVALDRGFTLAEAVTGLQSLQAPEKRGQVVQFGNITVVNDCYNSNPKALDAMVAALSSMPARRRIAIAGEMLELGPAGSALHSECGEHMAEKNIDVLVGVRGLAAFMVEAAAKKGVRAEFVETPEAAGEWMARELKDGDVVLLKASRGVKLERALETWQALTGAKPSS